MHETSSTLTASRGPVYIVRWFVGEDAGGGEGRDEDGAPHGGGYIKLWDEVLGTFWAQTV